MCQIAHKQPYVEKGGNTPNEAKAIGVIIPTRDYIWNSKSVEPKDLVSINRCCWQTNKFFKQFLQWRTMKMKRQSHSHKIKFWLIIFFKIITFFFIVTLQTPIGIWTHKLTLHPILMGKGCPIWAKAHWATFKIITSK